MTELKLTQIWIYPIKSLGGISLSSGTVMEKGLEYDRRLMLVDATGTAMTQRVFPKMALFKSSIDKGLLTITHHQHSMKLDLKRPPVSNPTNVNIWDDVVSAFDLDVLTINGFQNCSICRADWFIFQKKIPGRLTRDMGLTTSR